MALLIVFLLFWFAALVGVAMLAVPLTDLFRRENQVRWWYGLPTLPALLWLATVPIAVAVERDFGWQAIENVGFVLAWFHFTLAGAFLYLGVSLAVVRGLRPGGPTRRRLRTSLAATVILGLLGVQPVLWSVIDEAYAILTAWLAVGSFFGVLWVWMVNREGPWRLTEGKRWSAAFLTASFFQLGLAATQMAFILRQAYPHDLAEFTPPVWLLITPVLLLLPLGLRFLSGPLPPLPLLASAATALTLLLPPALFAVWQPYDGDLPRWVDLRGEVGKDLRVTGRIHCVRTPQDARKCMPSYRQRFTAASPGTPLDELAPNAELLVEDGRRAVQGKYAVGSAHLLIEERGLARLDGGPPLPLGPALHEALQNASVTRAPILVRRTSAWTAQDFVSICASYPFACELE